MSDRRHGVVRACLLFGVLGVVGCSSPRPQLGGETHWLRSCWSDGECGDALSCICGSCTRTCHEDDVCEGGKPAACYEQDSPLLLQRCAGTSPDVHAAAGVCLPLCASDAQCSGGKRCEQGACVPAEPAADADAGQARSAKPQISDYDDVSVEISTTREVQLPELDTAIGGTEASRLIGVWNGTPCTGIPNAGNRDRGCSRIVVTQDASGTVSGYLQLSQAASSIELPPPTDPNTGYPPGLTLSEVQDLAVNGSDDVRYPLRDGRFENGVFTFVWSPLDLFASWCALQVPEPWTIEGHTLYTCAPQDPSALAAVDPIKLALCVSASLGPWCPVSAGAGEMLPCRCIGATANCSDAVCRCQSDRCEADVRGDGNRVTLSVDGDTMTGESAGWQYTATVRIAPTFQRERP